MTDSIAVQVAEIAPFLPEHLQKHLSPEMGVDDMTIVLLYLTALRRMLSTYLPRYLVELTEQDPAPGRVQGGFREGTVMFADVSGFTAMSERLSALGKEGAEEITRIVNDYFETMLTISAQSGGDLLKFGGDALLLFFEGADGPQRALVTGQQMQQAMSRFAQVETSQGVFPLRMSIGMGTGPVFLASLGSADSMEYAVMGRALANMAQAEDRAEAGQVMVDSATRAATSDMAIFRFSDQGFWLLERFRAPIAAPMLDQVADHVPPTVTQDTVAGLLAQCRHHLSIIAGLQPFVPDDLFTRLIVDPQRHSLEGAHRPVTVMFANFYGIDEIIEALGPAHEAAITEILNTHFQAMSDILSRYGGVVNKVDSYAIGHRIMALFGALRANEDDPQRAVRAALDMNQALERVNIRTREILATIPDVPVEFGDHPLKQRIGLNSGFVFAGNVGASVRREYSVMGDEVNLTARLMSVAKEGQVLISQTTARHVERGFDLTEQTPVQVKGKSQPVRNFVVRGVRETQRRLGLTPSRLVGRELELTQAKAAIDDTVLGGGRLLLISGVSGIGKSRFTNEVVRLARQVGMQVLNGACVSYGKTLAYHPWAEILRAYFQLRPDDEVEARIEVLHAAMEAAGHAVWTPIIADVLGLDVPDNDLTRNLDAQLRRQRFLDVTLDLLQQQAARQPLLLVVEDAHWADPASLDLINYVARNIETYPVLFVLPHRPDQDLPGWTDHEHAVSLPLNELSAGDSLKVVENMLGTVSLPEPIQAFIVEKGSGNPLFIEEVVRTLTESAVLQQGENGQWGVQREVQRIDLPDTVHGIIISRIDRLTQTDRHVLQVASVIGRIFAFRLLNGAYPYSDLQGNLERCLDDMNQAGLTELMVPQDRLYAFRHLTTQEVVYQTQSFEQRRNLHRQIAAFIERSYADSLSEQTGLLAYHFFQGQNWEKARDYNLLAAEKARNEFANDTAIANYQLALQAAERSNTQDSAACLATHEGLGDVLTLVGQYDEAIEQFQAARKLVEDQAESETRVRHLADLCRKLADVYERRSEYDTAFDWLEQGLAHLQDQPANLAAARIYLLGAGLFRRQGKTEDAIDWCQRTLGVATEIPSREGQQVAAQAYYNLGGISTRLGELQQAVQYCQDSVKIYEAIDDQLGLSQAYLNLANAYNDLGDWLNAIDAYQKSMAIKKTIGDILYQGFITNNLGNIYLYRGDWDEARALFEQSNAIWHQLGAVLPEAVTLSNLAQVLIYQQNWDESQVYLQKSQDIFTSIGSEDFLPELYRRWAIWYLQTDRLAEAQQHIEHSLGLAAAQDARLEQGISLRVQGEVYRAHDNADLAEEALQRSLDILTALNSEYEAARTHLVLAELLCSQRPPQGQTHLEAARTVFERLGAHADLRKLEALEARLKLA